MLHFSLEREPQHDDHEQSASIITPEDINEQGTLMREGITLNYRVTLVVCDLVGLT